MAGALGVFVPLIHYDGTSWSAVSAHIPSTAGYSIHGTGPDSVVVGGNAGKVMKYECSSIPVIPVSSVSMIVLLLLLLTANLARGRAGNNLS